MSKTAGIGICGSAMIGKEAELGIQGKGLKSAATIALSLNNISKCLKEGRVNAVATRRRMTRAKTASDVAV